MSIQLALHEAHKARQARMTPAPMLAPQVNDPMFPPIQNYWLMCANEIAAVLNSGDGDCGHYLRAINAPPVRTIQDACCRHYGITRTDLLSRRRQEPLVTARHIAMYLARILTARSYPEIGRMFNRDHTVAIHAYNRISQRLAEFDADISTIRAGLQ